MSKLKIEIEEIDNGYIIATDENKKEYREGICDMIDFVKQELKDQFE